jgi:hypothetical protein
MNLKNPHLNKSLLPIKKRRESYEWIRKIHPVDLEYEKHLPDVKKQGVE